MLCSVTAQARSLPFRQAAPQAKASSSASFAGRPGFGSESGLLTLSGDPQSGCGTRAHTTRRPRWAVVGDSSGQSSERELTWISLIIRHLPCQRVGEPALFLCRRDVIRVTFQPPLTKATAVFAPLLSRAGAFREGVAALQAKAPGLENFLSES